MKRLFLSLSLGVLLLFNGALNTYTVVAFLLNRDVISREQCQYKDVPSSCCKGSCVLVKEVSKSENDASQPFQKLLEGVETDVFLTSCKEVLPFEANATNPFGGRYVSPGSDENTEETFQPPCLA